MSFEKISTAALEMVFIQPGVMIRTIFKKKKKKKKEILFVYQLNVHNGKRRDNLFSAETFRQENVLVLLRAVINVYLFGILAQN